MRAAVFLAGLGVALVAAWYHRPSLGFVLISAGSLFLVVSPLIRSNRR